MGCMAELGELERHHQDFEKRKVRVVAISMEDLPTALLSQGDFPDLVMVGDAERKMCEALQLIHAGAGPGGRDTAVSTTILVDGDGTVRWLFRPDRVFVLLSPAQLLAAVDQYLL